MKYQKGEGELVAGVVGGALSSHSGRMTLVVEFVDRKLRRACICVYGEVRQWREEEGCNGL